MKMMASVKKIKQLLGLMGFKLLVIEILLVVVLAGCGQRGSLYLPPEGTDNPSHNNDGKN